MKKIVFEGSMAAMYPDGIEVNGESARECIALLANVPGFREQDGVQYTVVLPDFQSRDAIFAKTDMQVIRMVETMEGAGGKIGLYLIIIIGVILIATGVGAGAGATIIAGGISASTFVAVGLTLVLNGISQLLAAAPKSSGGGDSDNQRSNYLNTGSQNTVKIGTRIPLIFGKCKVAGHFLSYNITATNLPQPSAPPELGYKGFNATVDSNYIPEYEVGLGGDSGDGGDGGTGGF